VVDCLGDAARDDPAAWRALVKEAGVGYVSVAPQSMLNVMTKGLPAVWAMVRGKDGVQAGARAVAPAEGEVRAVEEFLRWAAGEMRDGTLKKYKGDYVRFTEWVDATQWPRDGETGYRYGFPAPADNAEKLWGQLAAKVSDEYDAEDSSSEDALDPALASPLASKTTPLFAPSSTAELEAQLAASPAGTATFVFVAASWCRKCKFMKAQYAKVAAALGCDAAGRAGNIVLSIINVDLDGDVGEDGRSAWSVKMGVESVPEFLVFDGPERQEGYRVSTRSKLSMQESIRNIAAAL